MRPAVRTALPFLVAFVVPATALGVLFVAAGQSPLYGVFGGSIALLGALLMRTTRLAIHRRAQEAELDEVLQWLRAEQRRSPCAERVPGCTIPRSHRHTPIAIRPHVPPEPDE